MKVVLLLMSITGVVPLAHTPLAKGLATGLYTASNPTGGKMGAPKYNFQDLMPLAPIHTALVQVRFNRCGCPTGVLALIVASCSSYR